MNIRKRTWISKGVRKHAWMLDWRPETGRRFRRHFATRQEAELAFAKLRREHHAHEYGTLVDRISFKDFRKLYEEKKPWRTDTYRERVMISLETTWAGFDDVLLTEITPERIETVRDRRATKVKPSTLRQDLAALSDCLAWAVKLRYLNRNPAEKVNRPLLPTKQDNPASYLPQGDLRALLDAGGKDQPLYEFAVATGLRESELLALQWPDIKDGYVVVRLGKGRKQRIVPLVPQAVEALQKIPKRLKEARVFWWLSSRYDIYKRFRRRLEWARLSGYRFHDLRHTFASYAAMAGVDIQVIAEAMGHSTTTVTRRYAHLSPEYRRQELQKMAKVWGVGTSGAQKAENVQ